MTSARRSFRVGEFVLLRVVRRQVFFFSSRRRHTRCSRDWSSDVCSSDLLDIAPQFESLEALERCGATWEGSLADPLSRRHLEAHGRQQCVLIGYSDSNKEGGACASRFAIHQAQGALAQVLAACGERPIIFHARGGSIPRGGGRIDTLVRAAPAGAVNGTLRLREQGETVKQGYGLRPIAMRTLERAFNALSLATSAAGRGKLPADSPAHLECAQTLVDASRAAYRRLVHGERDFYEYFRAVTPIDVIEGMQIGSRVVQRAVTEGIEALLPVPWVFAWTQSRHMLPGWYGAGSGLRVALERYGLSRLREAYANWFFRSEEHTSELQSRLHLVCRLLLEKKKHSRLRPNRCHL